MKILFLLCLLLFPPFVFAGTEDQVETALWDYVLDDVPITFLTAAPTAGCTVVLAAAFSGSNNDMVFDATAVDDNQGNTYTVIQSGAAGRMAAVIAVASNVSTGDPFTITVHTNQPAEGFYGAVSAKSFCGVAAASLDRSGTGADPGPQAADANVATSLSTTQANEVVIAVVGLCEDATPAGSDTNLNVGTATTGYTDILTVQDCYNHVGGQIAWKNTSSQVVQTANWSHDDIVNSTQYAGWVVAIATLKDTTVTVVRRRAVIVQ